MNLTVPVPVRKNPRPLLRSSIVVYVRNIFMSPLSIYLAAADKNKQKLKNKKQKILQSSTLLTIEPTDRFAKIFQSFAFSCIFSRHLGALVHSNTVFNSFTAFKAFSRCNDHYRLKKIHFQFWTNGFDNYRHRWEWVGSGRGGAGGQRQPV